MNNIKKNIHFSAFSLKTNFYLCKEPYCRGVNINVNLFLCYDEQTVGFC